MLTIWSIVKIKQTPLNQENEVHSWRHRFCRSPRYRLLGAEHWQQCRSRPGWWCRTHRYGVIAWIPVPRFWLVEKVGVAKIISCPCPTSWHLMESDDNTFNIDHFARKRSRRSGSGENISAFWMTVDHDAGEPTILTPSINTGCCPGLLSQASLRRW